jgi:hypothetical protein
MSRKRAPGAGRKPKGEFTGKSSTFTTRITAETRAALDHGAYESGLSLSQYVELLLKNGIRKQTKAEQRNRALGAAIERLAENIEGDTGGSWREDAFTGLSLRHAVETWLAYFAAQPSGALTVPASIEEMAAKMGEEYGAQVCKPAGLGHLCARGMIHEIESAMRNPDDDWTVPIYLNLPNIGFASHLARDLGLNKREKKDERRK